LLGLVVMIAAARFRHVVTKPVPNRISPTRGGHSEDPSRQVVKGLGLGP
jgi:hypothetical protein